MVSLLAPGLKMMLKYAISISIAACANIIIAQTMYLKGGSLGVCFPILI